MKYIYLVALGNLQESMIECAEKTISDIGFLTRTLVPQPEPVYAYLEHRGQYDASKIIDQIIQLLPQDGLRIIALTEVDLCTLVLTFVFGAAGVNTAAVVSATRLRQEFYKLPPNQNLFLERLVKEVRHELGHTFGLVHCSQPHCVMSRSATIAQIDTKTTDFCLRCRSRMEVPK